ncbi:ABC-2 type transport system ATP-binding protein [Mycolicibacterium sp. BK556]|uniref:alpha/beta hydrolase n=1 Tax=unclassified Mycolicibacterium TaxID=2636767 RepID=UPI00160AEBBF|nr:MULTISPECIES: CocE/NonD family hydrolase [unclassified Mycolicibacterium]MBB3604931.1 ABC-2 type transport system ATP-binding protein [Mycolicibacterium sp. BK556]MBB3635127.1 ABC-2 type transport system ATP-binding protein [Mycolicibacterium sp. BK607]
MGAGAFVGRIGGLAVALGIGVAIAYGAGEAAAAPSPSTGSSSTGSAAPRPAAQHGTKVAGKPATPKASVRAVALPRTTATATAARTGVTDDPSAPTDASVTLALAAASRRDAPGTAQRTLTAAAAPAPAADVPSIPTGVVAIPQTAPLAFLQRIPVVGPVLFTPIVAFIHQIPVLGDILHPLVGYPVYPGTPANAARPRDVKIVSFDGTEIYVHFMPATGLKTGEQAPTVLDGPGLGMPGQTSIDGSPLDGVLTNALGLPSILALRNAGYNVVTWDPRGEYSSGGQLEIDSPDYEARDVSAIISWLATQPEVALDGDPANLDPKIGMVGASYGGGIQLVTAAIDHRVDAIVPTIAWNSLNTSLYKAQSFKSGWGTILAGVLVLTLARTNPAIIPATIYGDLTGSLTQADQDLLGERGPGLPTDLLNQITAPTMFVEGTVDTLFTLAEANANAQVLMDNNVATKVLWFCGGHGVCTNDLFNTGGVLIQERTIQWLDRYVKGDPAVPTGPQFEWVDQRGQHLSTASYDLTPSDPVVATSTKTRTLTMVPFVGAGGLLGVLPIGSSRAINAINLTTPAVTTTTYVVGTPHLTFTYSGTGTGDHLYAQLVDNSTGQVLGNQVTPIKVTLDGTQQTADVDLEMVAQTLKPGQKVTLQLFSSSASYRAVGSQGQLTVSNIDLTLPTVDPSTITVNAA